jgi:ribonuclease P protein component
MVPTAAHATRPDGVWLGMVVPKRHARRAVTRTLLKRQIRGAVARHAALLSPGLWVVRMRSGFERDRFPSAASDALRLAVQGELERLVDACVGATGGGALSRTGAP